MLKINNNLKKNHKSKKEKLIQAFKYFDENESGKINLEQMNLFL